jgi:hypothetical protein
MIPPFEGQHPPAERRARSERASIGAVPTAAEARAAQAEFAHRVAASMASGGSVVYVPDVGIVHHYMTQFTVEAAKSYYRYADDPGFRSVFRDRLTELENDPEQFALYDEAGGIRRMIVDCEMTALWVFFQVRDDRTVLVLRMNPASTSP